MIKATTVASVLLAAASGAELKTARKGKAIFEQYIVRLGDGENLESMRTHLSKMKSVLGGDMEPMFVYENLAKQGVVAYSAKLSARGLEALLREGVVSYVEEDQVVSLDDCKSESDPDWGLARVNHANYTATGTYTYDYTTGSSGNGVTAYIIDTGIYCENNDFTSKTTGTCTFGYSSVTDIFGTVDVTDGNGHGTHCAGTVAGQTYGVAKEANLVAVKVLSDRGSGSTSGVISGIDWVAGNAKKPAVANMSLGGGYSDIQNAAVASCVSAGVTIAVAAGNDDADACDYSPASEPSAITVAATDKTNARASYSNYGSCCDIFGPGSSITSAWIGSPDATNTISGTSMASPHICGLAAAYLSRDTSLTPTQLASQITSTATKNVVTDVQGTPNLMGYASCV